MDLKGRNFLTLKDFTKEEIEYLLDLSADLKKRKRRCSYRYAERQEHCFDF